MVMILNWIERYSYDRLILIVNRGVENIYIPVFAGERLFFVIISAISC